MKTKFKFIFLFVAAAIIFSYSNLQAQPNNSHAPVSAAAVELKMDMRKLWEDHITWTRNVIFNIVDELPGTSEAVERLLQNQVDIGDAIEPYYGAAAGDQLTALLQNHIVIAADLLTALDDGDSIAFSAANTAWFANADSIAMFLNVANPGNWSFTDAQAMMYDHLNLTAAEALARKNADYEGDVTAYDNVHNEILEMADFLSNGIIMQFPSRFRGSNRMYISLSDGILLNQNFPNPFSEETEITYFVSEDIAEAKILFYNSAGKLIKSVDIESRGEGSIVVSALNLCSGIYSYSIVADGKLMDTKQMIH